MDWKLFITLLGVLATVVVLKRISFISPAKATELLKQGALVIDVRNPGEFNSGHVPGALNIPLGDLSSELPRCVPDRNKVLLLHCLSGARSGIARQQLRRMGYLNSFNMGSYSRAESIVRKAPQTP